MFRSASWTFTLVLQLAMTAEAQKLAAASFGETMLHALGKVYEIQSDIALGNIFQGAMAKMRLQGDSIRCGAEVCWEARRIAFFRIREPKKIAYSRDLEGSCRKGK